MRGATDCARRLKSFFGSLRNKLGKVMRPAPTDPVTQLVLGVFSRDMPEARAREALDTLRSMVVDYNELRVIPPIEMAGHFSDYPDIRLKCEDVSRALNRIFAIEHIVSLDRLKELNRRDMLAYLDKIDGLDPYTRARIRLLGLEQHAAPLDEAMWSLARDARIVDDKCDLEEAQQFLERHVAPDDAVEFYALVKKQAWSEYATAVRKREVRAILSVPPDRTSRNMLQQLVATGSVTGVIEDDELGGAPLDDAEFLALESAAGEKPRKAGGKNAKTASKARPPRAARAAKAAPASRRRAGAAQSKRTARAGKAGRSTKPKSKAGARSA